MLTYIELFAGAGGLAEGFIRQGFNPVLHIEMDPHASFTLKTRMGYHYLKKIGQLSLYYDYIRKKISREQFYDSIPDRILSSVLNVEIKEKNLQMIFDYIRKKMKDEKIKKINVILGGPPCQAYSLMGRGRDRYKMEKDPRNYLYKYYVEFLKRFSPDIFVFENVPGLLSAGKQKLWEDVQEYFRNAGYEIQHRLLDANDFGVLQRRRRLILVGWKKYLNLRYPEFEKDKSIQKYAVKDLLCDLPPLKPGEKLFKGDYVSKPTEYLRNYGIRKDKDILTLHIARRHNERDRKIYEFYIREWIERRRRPEYDELPEEWKTHKNRKVFKDRFKVVAPDLSYSQTVVAHLSPDGHYFIHPDINQLRSISVREAARLQSFPDDYYFEGPMTAMFKQIGNAVPPLMAEKIAEKIKELLNG